jgi:hypothetical protein
MKKRELYFNSSDDSIFLADYVKIRDTIYVGYQKIHEKPELVRENDFYEIIGYLLYLNDAK